MLSKHSPTALWQPVLPSYVASSGYPVCLCFSTVLSLFPIVCMLSKGQHLICRYHWPWPSPTLLSRSKEYNTFAHQEGICSSTSAHDILCSTMLLFQPILQGRALKYSALSLTRSSFSSAPTEVSSHPA